MKIRNKISATFLMISAASSVHAAPVKKVLMGAVGVCAVSAVNGSEQRSFRGRELAAAVSSCPSGTSAIPLPCENCDFESGDLSGGWQATDNAGVTTNVYGINAFSGNYYGYAIAGALEEWKSIKRTFTGLPKGTTISGYVGFEDADYCPFDDQGQLQVQVNLVEGPQTTTVKSWSACEDGFPVFRGWEPFEVKTTVAGDVTIEVRVKNVLDSILDSGVVIDDVNICAATCNKPKQAPKFSVCHNFEKNPQTICVDSAGLMDHLASHPEDALGSCN